ncbi:hypothetical protein RB195_002809 [Necator americanus]|uniref:Uncharacterized protein n=2 Tax=Necator americanus TaxID=51031 RepID=A0ABR1DL66_NECAM
MTQPTYGGGHTVWYPQALEYVHQRWREHGEENNNAITRPYKPRYRPNYGNDDYNSAPPSPPQYVEPPSSYRPRYRPSTDEDNYDFQPRNINQGLSQPSNHVSELGPVPPSGPPPGIHPPAPPFPEPREDRLRIEGEKKSWNSDFRKTHEENQ